MKKNLFIVAILGLLIAAAIVLYFIFKPSKLKTPAVKPLTEAAKQEIQRELSSVPSSAVAVNNRADSCYIIYDGYVYNISTYLEKDATKKAALEQFCGEDSTTALNSKKDASGKKVDIGLNTPQEIKNAWQKYLVGKLQDSSMIQLK